MDQDLLIKIGIGLLISSLILWFVIKTAVAAGIKKSQSIIISLLYKTAEKQGVSMDELDGINNQIKEHNNSL